MSVPTLENGGTPAAPSSAATPGSGDAAGEFFAGFGQTTGDPHAPPGGQPSIGGPSITIRTEAGHAWTIGDRDLMVLLAAIALGAHLVNVWGAD